MTPMALFLIFIPVGIAAEQLYLTSPIHELGHVLMGSWLGIRTTMHFGYTSFSGRGMSPRDLIQFMYAGVIFEIVVFLLISLFFAVRKPWVAGIATGVTLSAYATTITLSDMAEINYVGTEAFYIIGGIVVISMFFTSFGRIYRSGLSEPVV